MPTPGERAPEIELTDQDGNTVRLSDYRGRKLVLYFYPKDHTAACASQAAAFNARLPEIGKLGAAVLGVSRDSVGSHAKFAKDLGLAFPILSDPQLRAIQSYGVYGEKKMYGRTTMGVVRTTFVIDERGVVEKVFGKVKAARNAADVVEYLSGAIA